MKGEVTLGLFAVILGMFIILGVIMLPEDIENINFINATVNNWTEEYLNATANLTIGEDLDVWGNLFVNKTSSHNGTFYVGGGFNDADGGLTINAQGDIFTDGDLTYSGSTYVSQAVLVNGSHLPFADNIFKLGNTTLRWESLRVGTGTSSFAGNVGIGTTSPGKKLMVNGGIVEIATESPYLSLYDNVGGAQFKWGIGEGIAGTTAGLTIAYDSGSDDTFETLAMYIQNNGNVGIGTTTPSAKLDIVGQVEISNTSTGGNAGTDLCIDANNRICRCGSCA